jgi:hypothetical protein
MHEPRALTRRERSTLDALLSVDFEGVDALRSQSADVAVVGRCGCGCPSIDFRHSRGLGMHIRVNAALRDSHDGLFLYTLDDPRLGECLGGIEYVGVSDRDPDEFPNPGLLDIHPA